jgi:hypothetical protein
MKFVPGPARDFGDFTWAKTSPLHQMPARPTMRHAALHCYDFPRVGPTGSVRLRFARAFPARAAAHDEAISWPAEGPRSR